MTIIYDTNGTLEINGQPYSVGTWEATKEDTVTPVFFPLKRFTVSFHFRQTRRQYIQARRLFGLPTSLHRREKRRARKRKARP